MSKRLTLEEKLATISALEKEPDALTTLCNWLSDSQNVVIARAADVLGKRGQAAGIPALLATFTRLIDAPQPAAADKTCRAKEAIVTALDALGNDDPAPYVRGIRHVQMEPVYGGRVDAAASLRGACAVALARMRHEEAHCALAPLLFDTEASTRVTSIKALTFLGGPASEVMLRMLVLAGEDHPGVIGECFAALLLLEPERSLPFVAGYLQSSERPLIEQAALALGQSHLEAAFPLLRACWEANADFTLRKTLLLSLALTRCEEAFTCLLAVMQEGDATTAVLACDALALFGVDRRYRERIAAVVAACHQPRLADAFTAHFPPEP